MAIDLKDWKTDAAIYALGAVVGGPVGLIAGAAISIANRLGKKPPTGTPAGFTTLTAPPPPAVAQAASALIATKPAIGTSTTVVANGKAYLLKTEVHPGSPSGNLGAVSIYQKA
jgi:hypothetical protein